MNVYDHKYKVYNINYYYDLCKIIFLEREGTDRILLLVTIYDSCNPLRKASRIQLSLFVSAITALKLHSLLSCFNISIIVVIDSLDCCFRVASLYRANT